MGMGSGQTLVMGITVLVSPDRVLMVFCMQLMLATVCALITACWHS
jgi:hypothetical protein